MRSSSREATASCRPVRASRSAIRPEFVRIAAPAPDLLTAEIERIDDLGRTRFARVRVGDLRMAAQVPNGQAVAEGAAGLVFDPAQIHVYADSPSRRGDGVMEKITNQKAWLLVLPVFALVAFSAVIPLMTVVNYSVQDTFGNNAFFWNGVGWYHELLDPSTELGGRFFASLWRNLAFSAIVLAIQIPLGIVVALAMPREGWGVAFSLVVLALPLLIPWNVVGTIWQIFGRSDIGLLGWTLNRAGFRLQLRRRPDRRLAHHHRHGCLALVESGGAALLRRAEVDSRGLLPGGQHRRRVALGRVHGDPAAEDEARAGDRRPAALHGFVHDLHRAVRA